MAVHSLLLPVAACALECFNNLSGAAIKLMNTGEKQRGATESAGYIVGVGVGYLRRSFRGKHTSAAIIVLAAAILLLGGSYIRHSDTRLFVQFVACVVGAIGLTGWLLSVQDK